MSLNKKLSDEQIIELTLQGAPKIKEVLSGLAVGGMEYYISNTNDENDMTASISNNAYKIHFETVTASINQILLWHEKLHFEIKKNIILQANPKKLMKV